jgi:SPP1 family phage portal protein
MKNPVSLAGFCYSCQLLKFCYKFAQNLYVMDPQFFLDNLLNPVVLIPEIHKEHCTFFDVYNYRQYYPKNHAIHDKAKRQDKMITLERDIGDGKTQPYQKLVPVTRIALPYQKHLTLIGNAFLTGGEIKLNADPKDDAEEATLKKLNEVWEAAKLDFKNNQIGKAIYSETECAEIWYSTKTEVDGKPVIELKCNVFSPSDGSKLMPVFDSYRTLIAFARAYSVKQGQDIVKCFDIYTATDIWKYQQLKGGNWELVPFKKADGEKEAINSIKLVYGKIPVIFYQVCETIWHDVQCSIERLELAKSNHADQNDYTGSPILAASGKVLGFSMKGETGKVIELENGADLKYVVSDQAPESVKMEMGALQDDIHTLTQTPNVSFEKLSLISGQLSAPIMDRMLTPAHIKAKDLQLGTYGEGIQRRINFLIKAITEIYDDCKGGEKLKVKPEFGLFRIGENTELIELLMKMNGGLPIASQEETIQMNPMVKDSEETISKIKEQETAKVKTEPAP